MNRASPLGALTWYVPRCALLQVLSSIPAAHPGHSSAIPAMRKTSQLPRAARAQPPSLCYAPGGIRHATGNNSPKAVVALQPGHTPRMQDRHPPAGHVLLGTRNTVPGRRDVVFPGICQERKTPGRCETWRGGRGARAKAGYNTELGPGVLSKGHACVRSLIDAVTRENAVNQANQARDGASCFTGLGLL